MKALTFVLNNLRQYKRRFYAIMVIAVLDGIVVFFIPASLAEFTRQQLTMEAFYQLGITVAVLYACSLLLEWFIRRYGESIGTQFGNTLRLVFFEQLEKLPYKHIRNQHSGYILSLINKVADGLFILFIDLLWSYTYLFVTTILFFVYIVRESWELAVLNAGIIIVFSILSYFLSRQMIPLMEAHNKKRASLLESYTDFMANILTVKKLGIYGFVESRLEQKTQINYDQIDTNYKFHAIRWFILHGIFGVAFISTIIFILFQVQSGAMSVGLLIIFISSYEMIRRKLGYISESVKRLMEMGVYIENLNEILQKEKKREEEGEKKPSFQTLSFQNVSYRHPGNKAIMRIPQFTIKKGEKICIMGTSGEGKSTFLNLFANFLRPDEGSRTIDGIPYDEIASSTIDEQMVLISQEVELFNISLHENLTLGEEVSREKMQQMLEDLRLAKWVQGLKDGLNTVVGEKGIKLSSGQKQRINLMRALLLEKEIYLFDEPASHLDEDTIQKVTALLKDHLKDKTAIIVSHHDALQSICSRTITMKNYRLEG